MPVFKKLAEVGFREWQEKYQEVFEGGSITKSERRER